MNNEKLIELQHFFAIDLQIKKEMYHMAPSNIKYFDDSTIQKYTDELSDSLTYIFSELKCVCIDIFGENSNVFARIGKINKKQFLFLRF